MLAEAPAVLEGDLLDSRERTLRAVAPFHGERLLGPRLAIVNPPLWEIGHVAWFQERWCLRHRADGSLKASLLKGADALYDSSAVAHDVRWDLPLPTLEQTHGYLASVLELVRARLEREPESEALRYFVRLATLHEDMHGEAFHYTCQTLGYEDPLGGTDFLCEGDQDVPVAGGSIQLGAVRGEDAFVFDNEKWAHPVDVASFRIAAWPVSNAQYREYVESGGAPPRYWKREGGAWLERRFDAWQPLRDAEPVRHVDWNEAQAFCRWAGRRLPSEAEFELALKARAIRWGALWEWTSSVFMPYPGFRADPYEDYSQPWFGTHKVLRGGSFSAPRRLLRPTFRNFYTAERGDVFCGFRTCER